MTNEDDEMYFTPVIRLCTPGSYLACRALLVKGQRVQPQMATFSRSGSLVKVKFWNSDKKIIFFFFFLFSCCCGKA